MIMIWNNEPTDVCTVCKESRHPYDCPAAGEDSRPVKRCSWSYWRYIHQYDERGESRKPSLPMFLGWLRHLVVGDDVTSGKFYGVHTTACPGCGCEPGDGVTPGCSHPDGCGYWEDMRN
jgi:hypothetical protein